MKSYSRHPGLEPRSRFFIVLWQGSGTPAQGRGDEEAKA